MKEFTMRQGVRDFFDGVLVQQPYKTYSKETVDRAVDTMYKLWKKASEMDPDDADAYLTTCLGVYILASYEPDDDNIITDISPKE